MKRVLLSLLIATPAAAADLTVGPTDSIQAAIDLALDGDRVLVQPATHTERINFNGKAIEVIGLGGAANTTLNGGGLGPVVRFASGEGSASRLQGFTITGGSANAGAGGIACSSGATPTIEDCSIRFNRGKFGGGVTGSPILRRCVIEGNLASLTHGGGVYGAPQMSHCVVTGNRASSADGGGIYLVNGTASITDCVIVDNGAVFANSSGGGLYIDSSATAAIERTVFSGNYATGGVFAGYGGGVYAESAGSSLTSCTVVGNSVSGSSTFGAGLFGPLAVRNSIVRDNLGGPDISGASSVAYSNVGGSFGGSNLDLDSSFVSTTNRDFHLMSDSPLIDSGDPSLVDADGSRSDIGAHAYAMLYSMDNTDSVAWADPSWPVLSGKVGGHQTLGLQADPVYAGKFYLVLGSISGETPGTSLLGFHIPLNRDFYFRYTLNHPNQGPLANSAGILDATGAARFTVNLATGSTGLDGIDVSFAALVADLSTASILDVTNAETLQLVR